MILLDPAVELAIVCLIERIKTDPSCFKPRTTCIIFFDSLPLFSQAMVTRDRLKPLMASTFHSCRNYSFGTRRITYNIRP